MPKSSCWRYADRRCELWIVNGAPRLRLFEDDSVLRDFGVTGARDAMQLAATWKASAESLLPAGLTGTAAPPPVTFTPSNCRTPT